MDIFLLKQLLKNLVLPPTGPLLLAFGGLLWALVGRRRAWPLALCAAGLALQWVLATPAVADALMLAAQRYPALDLNRPTDAQAIVILAGGVRRHAAEYGGRPAPSSTTLQRIVYGALVAHKTGLPVLLSGGHAETVAMRTFLAAYLGVKPKWIDDHARDTEQNAQDTAAILKPQGVRTVILVTSAEHMARALVEFRVAGLRVVAAPAEIWTGDAHSLLAWVPSADGLVCSYRALYEFLGRFVQSIRLDLAHWT